MSWLRRALFNPGATRCPPQALHLVALGILQALLGLSGWGSPVSGLRNKVRFQNSEERRVADKQLQKLQACLHGLVSPADDSLRHGG
jgi:hypothetical protein